MLIKDDIEYAHDASVFIQEVAHEQMCERMGNYDIITETIELKIHWRKYF